MDLNKALQILNLQENYTEEQLKKAYRKLIVKYHPDKHPDNIKEFAEQQTKIINDAKDILEKNLKNRNQTNQANNSTYNRYNQNYQNETNKEEYLKILKKFEDEFKTEVYTIEKIIKNNTYDKLFHENKLRFIKILNEFSYRIPATRNIASIKKEYQSFRRQYVNELVNYYIEFERISNIDTNNYFIHYYDTLDEIRTLMHDTIDNILKKELLKFKDDKHFNEASPLLYSIKEGHVLSCLYGLAKIENIKKNFINQVTYELKNFQKRKKLLDELESEHSYVLTNLKTITNLRENILSEKEFYNIYSQINIFTKIKCKTKNLLKRK